MNSAVTQTRLLADEVIAGKGSVRDAARIFAANVLVVLCAWVALPLPWTPVPVTGQTYGVMLVAVLLGSRRGAAVMTLYLLEGIAGLPVFQPFGAPGVARLAGPTAGYLLAYPAAAGVIGWMVEHGAGASLLRLASALLTGEAIIFAGGCSWLLVYAGAGRGLDWTGALRMGALPFLPGELLKIALVLAAVRGIELARRRG